MTLHEGIIRAIDDTAHIWKVRISHGPGWRTVEVLEFKDHPLPKPKMFVITDQVPIKTQIEEALRVLPDGFDKIPLQPEGVSDDDTGWLLTCL
jgi:hypothetical protein